MHSTFISAFEHNLKSHKHLQARLVLSSTRRYASTTPEPAKKSSSNLGIYFAGAGVIGLGAYAYIRRSELTAKMATPIQEKSPFDPTAFVNFKLKKVEPYNHNTAK